MRGRDGGRARACGRVLSRLLAGAGKRLGRQEPPCHNGPPSAQPLPPTARCVSLPPPGSLSQLAAGRRAQPGLDGLPGQEERRAAPPQRHLLEPPEELGGGGEAAAVLPSVPRGAPRGTRRRPAEPGGSSVAAPASLTPGLRPPAAVHRGAGQAGGRAHRRRRRQAGDRQEHPGCHRRARVCADLRGIRVVHDLRRRAGGAGGGCWHTNITLHPMAPPAAHGLSACLL